MDYHSPDRTYKKSRFRRELERSVSRRLVTSLLLGCLLFLVAIAAVNTLNQNARREDHLAGVAATFNEVYNDTAAFLLDTDHTELFLSDRRKDQDNLRYLISQYNVSALVELQLILTDSKGEVRFTTFSEGEMNLHRQEFNRIAEENACHLMRAVYTTVYHFRANSSEYVMIHPLYRDGEYQGAAAVYLNENDWTKLFSRYQYDAILTKPNGDVIACSNASFLSQKNANKYRPADAARYVKVDGSRYLRSSRSLENGTVLAYSFIYSPPNYDYLLVGLFLILMLGLSWSAMFVRIMHVMTEQMVKSVDTLVQEIRFIRKEDPDHIIEIDTGDEIEEIAHQVNKMVRSIQELSQRNMDLVEVNSRMEMQNLQAQINPHFLYNTLDSIAWMCEQGRNADAVNMVHALARLFRISISKGHELIPIRKELEHAESYLQIQKYRYKNQFSYDFQVDESCLDCLCNKITLQPILENAIAHGLDLMVEPGHIDVEVCRDGKDILFRVRDDGVGMDEEQVQHILHSEPGDRTGIGIKNVNDRLRIYFGEGYGLRIESEPDVGTCVEIRMPQVREGEYETK